MYLGPTPALTWGRYVCTRRRGSGSRVGGVFVPRPAHLKVSSPPKRSPRWGVGGCREMAAGVLWGCRPSPSPYPRLRGSRSADVGRWLLLLGPRSVGCRGRAAPEVTAPSTRYVPARCTSHRCCGCGEPGWDGPPRPGPGPEGPRRSHRKTRGKRARDPVAFTIARPVPEDGRELDPRRGPKPEATDGTGAGVRGSGGPG